MAKGKKGSTDKVDVGEQLPLLDVTPENSKQIVTVARRYKAFVIDRQAVLEKEIAEKEKLLELIRKANLKRLEDGKIRFRVDGLLITVTPRDELVSIKEQETEGGK